MEDWREVKAIWNGAFHFLGNDRKGLQIPIGSTETDFSPMELILLGLAGCTGLDVVNILEKKRQILTGFEVRVRGKRREENPRIYTEIEIEYLCKGNPLDLNAMEQAVRLSQEKYCSASAILSETATIKTNISVLPE